MFIQKNSYSRCVSEIFSYIVGFFEKRSFSNLNPVVSVSVSVRVDRINFFTCWSEDPKLDMNTFPLFNKKIPRAINKSCVKSVNL